MVCDNWTVVSSISTLIAAISAFVAAIVVIWTARTASRELREITRSATIGALSVVLNELSTEYVINARRSLFAYKLPPPETLSLDHDVYRRFYAVWTSFEKVGTMVHFDLISKDLVFEMYLESIIRCWEKLEPYIKHERDRLEHREYLIYFEKLYGAALDYRSRTYGQESSTGQTR